VSLLYIFVVKMRNDYFWHFGTYAFF
jgi:hypothetical protein